MVDMSGGYVVGICKIFAIICVSVASCLADAPLNLHGPHICTKKEE